MLLITPLIISAQIQQAWVARYNNGITNGTNQAVKLALDSVGNVYVSGYSQNTNNQLGYVTIKYAPNGSQVWTARYDSTNQPTAALTAMAVDVSNNVIVAGTALTIKYDSVGNQLWAAPYAGNSLTIDSNANVYVVGFSQDFGTVKLSPEGSNIWLATYVDSAGPTVSKAVAVDSAANVYVTGLDTYFYIPPGGDGDGPYLYLTTIKYNSSGNQLWKVSEDSSPNNSTIEVDSIVLDNFTNVYVVAYFPNSFGFTIYRYLMDGSVTTLYSPDPDADFNNAYAFAVDSTGDILLAGQFAFYGSNYVTYADGTYKGDTNGSWIWTNLYPSSGDYAPSAALALAVDSANNSYVTGYSPVATGTNNIVTIKYSPNGNQLWLQSYNGLNAGNDAGNAIAVDKNGNVYVTGYETLPGGGTGIVTIKYVPISIQRQTNGTVLIETQGSPGESFDIQASSDLLNWLDLGTILADTNGLMQFDDTNAPNFPTRFYYTNPR